ncbi:hypothetical protein [Microlunatus sp. GCM10028923]|uniref:hypothetical protein n=1 Tax=Microlunatus sp. GCM10028923 TaxID=3273400 RepID=UPI003612C0C6
MTNDLPESLTVQTARRISVYRNGRIAGYVTGSSRTHDDGRPLLRLGLSEESGARDLEVGEGDTFDFAGATWQVTKVNATRSQASNDALTERTGGAGTVATLTRIASQT